MKCKDQNNDVVDQSWMYFLPDCNPRNPKCKPLKGAYLPAITICNQRIINPTIDTHVYFSNDFNDDFDILF